MDGKVAVRGLPNDVIIETEPRPSASRCVDGRAERYNSPGCRPISRSRVPGFQPVRSILEDEIDHHAEVTLPGKFKELLEFAGVSTWPGFASIQPQHAHTLIMVRPASAMRSRSRGQYDLGGLEGR